MLQKLSSYWPFYFALSCLLLAVGLGYNGLYGQDAHAYFQFSQNIRAVIWEGATPNHFFWPVLYPFLGAILSPLTTSQALVLQGISLLSLATVAYLIYRLLQQQEEGTEEHTRAYVFIAFCLAPTPLLYAFNTMADSLTVAFVMMSFFASFRFHQSNKNAFFLLAAGTAFAAFLTRYAAAVVVVIPCLWLCYLLVSRKKWLLIVLSALLLAFIALPHFWLKGVEEQALSHHWLANWDFRNFFRSEFQTIDGLHTFPRPNITFILQHLIHPRFLCMGILLLPFIRKQDIMLPYQKTLLASALLYAFFLGGITYQSNRYLLLNYPIFILLLYPAFTRLISFLKAKHKWLSRMFLLGAASLQVLFFIYYVRPFYQRNQLEQAIVQELKQQDTSNVYSFGVESALESYKIPQSIHSLWEKPYPSFEQDALVIFNLQANREQWKGRNPMINWNKLRSEYQLTKLKVWKDGWELFRVEAKN